MADHVNETNFQRLLSLQCTLPRSAFDWQF
jgi:hypothetical protein